MMGRGLYDETEWWFGHWWSAFSGCCLFVLYIYYDIMEGDIKS